MSKWRPLDQSSSEDYDFSAQYCEETNELANFWCTIVVLPRSGMSDTEMIALMARLETAAGDDLA